MADDPTALVADNVAEATLEITITRGPNHPRPGSVEHLGVVSEYKSSPLQRAAQRLVKFLRRLS